jgi:hypothetical protein
MYCLYCLVYCFLFVILFCLYELVRCDRRSAVRGSAWARLWRRPWVEVVLWGRQVVLDHISVLIILIHTFFYMHAWVYNLMDPKLRTCLVSIVLPWLNLDYLLYVVAMLVVHLLRLGWLAWKQCYTCFTLCFGTLYGDNHKNATLLLLHILEHFTEIIIRSLL